MEDKTGLFLIGLILGALALGALAERLRPWRRDPGGRPGRIGRSVGLYVQGAALLAFLPPLTAMGAAAIAGTLGTGLLSAEAAPLWVRMLAALLLLDFGAYVAHRLLHRGPIWRLHRVHHSDRHVDGATSLRFHPFEFAARGVVDGALIVLVAPGVDAVFGALCVVAVVNVLVHTNARLPSGIERRLAVPFVTPALHKLHHAAPDGRPACNFGLVTTVWDRVFGTYRAPGALTDDAVFGIGAAEQDTRPESFGALLLDPFRALKAPSPMAPRRAGSATG